MSEIIKKNIPVKANISKLLEILAIHEIEEKESLMALVEEAEGIVNAKAIYKQSVIRDIKDDIVFIDGISFKSSILAYNLKGIKQVFPFVITAGLELEKWAQSFNSVLEQYWLIKIQESLLQEAVTYIFAEIEEKYNKEKMATMSPGTIEEWPISGQKQLFELIKDIDKKIAVNLTDAYIMSPAKSLSGISFVNNYSYQNCKLCTRCNCPDRRADYDAGIKKLIGK